MNPKTIYTKTSKGVLEVKNKTSKLPRDVGLVFLAVDGKSTFADLLAKSGIGEKKLTEVLDKLTADGFVRVFTPASQASGAQPGADDLDFTSPAAVSRLNAEAETRTKAEAQAKARALAAARAAAEAKVRQETESRARVLAEIKAKEESEAKVKAEAAAKAAVEARAKAEAESKAAANANAKAEAETRVKAAMAAKARADAEAKARANSEMRAKAEAEAKAAAEAKAKEEADVQARAEVGARAHADAETKARVAVEAQMKALQDALAQIEARVKSEAAERSRMETEIKARADAERRAREEAEARAKAAEEAVVQARTMAEEAARAKAEAETKAAIESVGGDTDARARMAAAMKALEEAKAKARSESAARIDAERRARAEADARRREETESKVREEQERRRRDEQDARAKAQMRDLQEQARRAREDAEAKAAIERKAREEAEARMEAEQAARKEAEAKAATERETREQAMQQAREEAETKARAEVEAMIQAERKAREEAERRAKAEISAKVEIERKAREEAERQTEIARRAREEAERRAQRADAVESDAARRAREEAERKSREADQAVAQARAVAEAERLARAEAEERAKTETVARVLQEQQLRAKAEGEVQSRVQAEIKARELAEMEADAKYRQEAAARAKAAAEEQRKHEDDARTVVGSARPRKPANRMRNAGISVVVVIVLAVGLVHVVPLTGFIGNAQQVMTQRLQVPVTITNMSYALLPWPQLTLERVTIGKLQDIRIENIVVEAWPHTLLGDAKDFDSVVVNGVTADQDALAMVPGWARAPAGALPFNVRRMKLKSVRLAVKTLEIPSFDAEIAMGRDGALQRALLSSSKVRVDLSPQDKTLNVNLEARNWRPPLGPGVEFDELAIAVVFEPHQATVTSIEGRIGRGTIKGAARASWASGIRVEGDISIANGELAQVLAAFTRNFTASGTVNASATYTMQGAALQNLFAQPRVDANFRVEKGVLHNVDLVRAIQSPARDGVRGGKTPFQELTGSLQIANSSYSYRQLRLASGPMNASGGVIVSSGGELSGRISAELGSKSVVVARGSLNATGELKNPLLRQ